MSTKIPFGGKGAPEPAPGRDGAAPKPAAATPSGPSASAAVQSSAKGRSSVKSYDAPEEVALVIQKTGDFDGLSGEALRNEIMPGAIFRLARPVEIEGELVPAGAVGRAVRFYGLTDHLLDVAFDVAPTPDLRRFLKDDARSTRTLTVPMADYLDPAKFEWLAKSLPAKDQVRVEFSKEGPDRQRVAFLRKVEGIAGDYMATKGRKTLDGLASAVAEGMKGAVSLLGPPWKAVIRTEPGKKWGPGETIQVGRKEASSFMAGIAEEINRLEEALNGTHLQSPPAELLERRADGVVKRLNSDVTREDPEVGVQVVNSFFRVDADGHRSLKSYPDEPDVLDPVQFLAQVPNALNGLDKAEAMLTARYKTALATLQTSRDLVHDLKKKAEAAL